MTPNEVFNAVIFKLESAAEWRRDVATRFPNDRRNIESAELIERIIATADPNAGAVADLAAVWTRIDAAGDGNPGMAVERESDYLRQIGFGSAPKSFADVCSDLADIYRDAATRAAA